MSRFKVGDKVRVSEGRDWGRWEGRFGTVVELEYGGYAVVDLPKADGFDVYPGACFPEADLDLVEAGHPERTITQSELVKAFRFTDSVFRDDEYAEKFAERIFACVFGIRHLKDSNG